MPINVRLHRKGAATLLALAEEMIHDVARWFPDRRFRLCCDGFFAPLAGRSLPRTQVISRMRRDAALFRSPPPRRPGGRGRPRKKGLRLPSLEKIARRPAKGWTPVEIDARGRLVTVELFARRVLWYGVRPDAEMLLVIVRDPQGRQPDDFFFTTDLTASPASVASDYAARWAIEDTFRNVKQHLGGEHPQTWKAKGPERAAALSMWLYSAVWTWYLDVHGEKRTWPRLPWYPGKRVAAFSDALAALRRALWRSTIFTDSGRRSVSAKTIASFIDALAWAG